MSYTPQIAFDTVAFHLLAQGHRSLGKGVNIIFAYRGEGGTSCAIGCLIPDEEYDDQHEGTPVNYLLEHGHFPSLRGLVPMFLAQLQGVHDKNQPSLWPAALRAFATFHGLDTRILDIVEGRDR